jgi:hypothetical protein
MITFFQTKISAKQSFYATDEPNADNRLDLMSNAVIPAKAGIQCMLGYQGTKGRLDSRLRGNDDGGV